MRSTWSEESSKKWWRGRRELDAVESSTTACGFEFEVVRALVNLLNVVAGSCESVAQRWGVFSGEIGGACRGTCLSASVRGLEIHGSRPLRSPDNGCCGGVRWLRPKWQFLQESVLSRPLEWRVSISAPAALPSGISTAVMASRLRTS